jgi:hypothetical protein
MIGSAGFGSLAGKASAIGDSGDGPHTLMAHNRERAVAQLG